MASLSPFGPWWLVTGFGTGPWTPWQSSSSFLNLGVDLQNAINLRPGYTILSTLPNYSVNGSPSQALADTVSLEEEGYYEVDVFDPGGDTVKRYPICIVDSTLLAVSTSSADSGEPEIFRRLSDEMADAYPHGKVLPATVERSFGLSVGTNRAVALDIRKRTENNLFVKVGEALAKGPGVWRSEAFAMTRGPADLRLAATFADQAIVLG